MEAYLKHIEKNKGGLKIPLSIPQIHLYVDSDLTRKAIKYFRRAWGGFKNYTENTEVINIPV